MFYQYVQVLATYLENLKGGNGMFPRQIPHKHHSKSLLGRGVAASQVIIWFTALKWHTYRASSLFNRRIIIIITVFYSCA